MPRQAEMAAACRNLKNAIGVGGRAVASIAGRMVMSGAVMLGSGQLFENVMDLMGRRIKQKK
ncbi:MAG: hypothetical protein ACM3SP_00285 [Chloroflexota bacterium]